MIDWNIVAIIPARGGSKGIPRKNVRLFAGKPLIAYTIEQAQTRPAGVYLEDLCFAAQQAAEKAIKAVL